MPKGDKYIPLKQYLQDSAQNINKMTFKQSERIIDDILPARASIHTEAWWSNCLSHSQTVSWIDAGYETDCVSDIYVDRTMISREMNV